MKRQANSKEQLIEALVKTGKTKREARAEVKGMNFKQYALKRATSIAEYVMALLNQATAYTLQDYRRTLQKKFNMFFTAEDVCEIFSRLQKEQKIVYKIVEKRVFGGVQFA